MHKYLKVKIKNLKEEEAKKLFNKINIGKIANICICYIYL